MIDTLFMLIVLGVLVLALAVDVAALLATIRMTNSTAGRGHHARWEPTLLLR